MLALGFTLSKAFISIGFIGLCFVGLLQINTIEIKKIQWVGFLLPLSFLISAFSIINTEHYPDAFNKLVLKLPLLFFPLLIIAFSKLNEKTRLMCVLVFLYAMYLPAVVSVYNYAINKTLFDALILESKPLPIEFGYGIYHIQFSVLLAISVVLGTYYLLSFRKNVLHYVLLFLTISNAIMIHVLSARTGLLSMYLGLAVVFVLFIKDFPLKTKVAGIVMAFLLPVLFVFSSSSLRNRMQNTLKDLEVTTQQKDPNDHSFAMRIAAWQNAVDVIKKHPLLGVGIGDVEHELKNNFASFNPIIIEKNRKNPHNQFLETMVESGILNGVLLLFFAIYIMFYKKKKEGLLLLSALAVVLFSASFFESILERQATVVAFSLVLAFAWQIQNKEKNI